MSDRKIRCGEVRITGVPGLPTAVVLGLGFPVGGPARACDRGSPAAETSSGRFVFRRLRSASQAVWRASRIDIAAPRRVKNALAFAAYLPAPGVISNGGRGSPDRVRLPRAARVHSNADKLLYLCRPFCAREVGYARVLACIDPRFAASQPARSAARMRPIKGEGRGGGEPPKSSRRPSVGRPPPDRI